MRWLLLSVLALASGPASALEICDDLWFTRNLLFHRAGYCFGSALGRAVFGNEGCVPGPVELYPADVPLFRMVKAREAEWACKVDTSRTVLAVPDLETRKAQIDPPLATGYESGCIGWKGERLPLYTARHLDSPVVGAAHEGDTLLFQFEDVDGWTFVEVSQSGVPVGMGWARFQMTETSCDAFAG